MKEIETIQGESSGYNPNLTLMWEDPVTGEEMTCWGEFDIEDEKYIHDVINDDGEILYIVIAD